MATHYGVRRVINGQQVIWRLRYYPIWQHFNIFNIFDALCIVTRFYLA